MGGTVLKQSGLYERDHDLDQLTAPLLTETPRSLVVVEGPAGIGKTRLLAENRNTARQKGLLTLHAKGLELEQHYTFGVARQLLEPFLLGLAPEVVQAYTRGPASITRQLFQPENTDVAMADGPADISFAMLHGLTWLAINLVNDYPMLVQVDDLQWADEATLRWLLYLLPRIDDLPLTVIVALRRDATAGSPIAERIACNSNATVVRPRLLGPESVAAMLGGLLAKEVSPEFATACHAETGGNPFLVREIAAWLQNERVEPVPSSVPRLRAIGGLAVSRRVALRLAQLPHGARQVARALAVLGDGAELAEVTELSALSAAAASDSVVTLMQADLLVDRVPLAFLHPVVRSAVYEHIALDERAALHAAAARIAANNAADVERVAAHLMLAPPGIEFASRILRDAARQAAERGSPASAFGYLGRCRQESLEPDELLQVLVEQGTIGQLVDLPASAACLAQAHAMVSDPQQRAEIAWRLADSLGNSYRQSEGIAVLRASVAGLPPDHDLVRRAQACELLVASTVSDWDYPPGLVEWARSLPPGTGDGARMLDSVLAMHDALQGNPAAVARAGRALAGWPPSSAQIAGIAPAWLALVAADRDQAMELLDSAVTRLQHNGEFTALAYAYTFRSFSWNYRGQLSEAEADARRAMRLAEDASVAVTWSFAVSSLVEVLIEQGKLDEAQAILDQIGYDENSPMAPAPSLLLARARLRRLKGDPERARQAALSCGRIFAERGGRNPAIMPWRSELALCLRDLGDLEQARSHADEELALARQWGAPRALGRALRVCAAVQDSPAARHQLLQEAVAVLDGSPARLELATAMADLGAALLAGGDRAAARPVLRLALNHAVTCAAQPLADLVRSELRTAGSRPRRDDLSGVESLTPSERRIADLVVGGATNRQIAETLFVTPKTVELHLTNIYRKLSVVSRRELADVLAS